MADKRYKYFWNKNLTDLKNKRHELRKTAEI